MAAVPAADRPVPAVTPSRAVAEARTAIRGRGPAIHGAAGDAYREVDVVADPAGRRHVRFTRTHRGLDVLGGDFVVHTDATGAYTGVTIAQRTAVDVPVTPVITRKRAIAVAGRRFAGARARTNARLVVDAFESTPALAWEVTVSGTAPGGIPSDLVVVVDAGTGKVRRAYDEVHAADSATGNGVHARTVSISTTAAQDGWVMIDPDRGGNAVRDAGNLIDPGLTTSPLFTDADNVWGDGTLTDRASVAVDAHYGLAKAWDYFEQTFGRSGIADDGKGTTAYVHYSRIYKNAFWRSSCHCMFLGDGQPVPWTTLDIVAHELAHGLTDQTADLVYTGEAGALNEANSDIFATLVEFFVNSRIDGPDYTIGEDVTTSGSPLRYMAEPSKDGRSASCWTPQVKDLDVHHGSGIGNKFFYLLAVGSGTTPGRGTSTPCNGAPAVTGIGNDKAARIWYQALTAYMVSNTNWSGAREATLKAAVDLYGAGSTEAGTVQAAWLAVGVDGTDQIPTPPVDPVIKPIADVITMVGQPVHIQVTATDPQHHQVTFSAKSLPAGITISPDGLISGTPTTTGSGTMVLTATDSDGQSATLTVPWTVGPALPAPPAGVSVTGGNGTALVTWTDPSPAPATPLTGYQVRVSPGTTQTLPPTARSTTITGLDTRKTYTIGVRAVSIVGDGPEQTVTLSPITLPLAVSPTATTYAGTVTLNGRIPRGGTPIGGAVVYLDQRPAGAATWTRAATLRTDANGNWTRALKPATTTTYRVTYPGSSGMWPATSTTATATVRYAATVKAGTLKPKPGKKIKITGTVRPARPGVKVTLQRWSGGKWINVTNSKTTATGTYTFSRAFPKGTWTLRVVVAGGSYNATGTTRSIRLVAK
ncbi:M4 family metallopeptidase [Actinoplanes hulinensis]|uniref:M4 family metallopeptidase n=1 Tax=Actinoplanes hulinensis TaxID=1144547 RepID=A0ABS7BE80_9ACTN|nr:M4 family metallopeptidase [Actinoplanes hulinensis]MBW6439174.1 M4 family metallopeptidase [Actinoplanes hulinensis]